MKISDARAVLDDLAAQFGDDADVDVLAALSRVPDVEPRTFEICTWPGDVVRRDRLPPDRPPFADDLVGVPLAENEPEHFGGIVIDPDQVVRTITGGDGAST